MNAFAAAPRVVGSFDVSMTLPCGHRIPIPWDASAPAQMACVLDHQVHCTAVPADLEPLRFGALTDHRADGPTRG